jgi:hypothetical protein
MATSRRWAGSVPVAWRLWWLRRRGTERAGVEKEIAHG